MDYEVLAVLEVDERRKVFAGMRVSPELFKETEQGLTWDKRIEEAFKHKLTEMIKEHRNFKPGEIKFYLHEFLEDKETLDKATIWKQEIFN